MDGNRSKTRGVIGGQPLPQGVPSNLIALGGGYAFPDMLPDVSLEAANAARDFRTEVLQYGPLFGLTELRDEIVRYVAQDGVYAERDNIFVLNGAKQVLDLALRALVNKGDSVIVSRPSYATALHIIGNHEASVIEIEMDEDGMKVDELEGTLQRMRSEGEPLPKLLYDVPDFHNPTGITLSEDRRRKLVDLAEEFTFFIVEDDPYRRLRYDGAPIAPIKSFDRHGRVIGAGTFSKIFGPGIRVGWANGDADLVHRMAMRKSDGGTCPLTQRIILECLKTGKIDAHIQETLACVWRAQGRDGQGRSKVPARRPFPVPSGRLLHVARVAGAHRLRRSDSDGRARGSGNFLRTRLFRVEPPKQFYSAVLRHLHRSTDRRRRAHARRRHPARAQLAGQRKLPNAHHTNNNISTSG